jgi:hypothetical protein
MDFVAIPQTRWRVFNDIDQNVKLITEKCGSLLSLFEDTLSRRSILGHGAVRLELVDDSKVIAWLRTPLGDGRFSLSWTATEEDLLGVLLFERECRDKYDQRYWEGVWGVKIPRYENPYVGRDESKVYIQLDAPFEQDRRYSAMSALISILHGLVNGPVVTASDA